MRARERWFEECIAILYLPDIWPFIICTWVYKGMVDWKKPAKMHARAVGLHHKIKVIWRKMKIWDTVPLRTLYNWNSPPLPTIEDSLQPTATRRHVSAAWGLNTFVTADHPSRASVWKCKNPSFRAKRNESWCIYYQLCGSHQVYYRHDEEWDEEAPVLGHAVFRKEAQETVPEGGCGLSLRHLDGAPHEERVPSSCLERFHYHLEGYREFSQPMTLLWWFDSASQNRCSRLTGDVVGPVVQLMASSKLVTYASALISFGSKGWIFTLPYRGSAGVIGGNDSVQTSSSCDASTSGRRLQCLFGGWQWGQIPWRRCCTRYSRFCSPFSRFLQFSRWKVKGSRHNDEGTRLVGTSR